MEYSVRVWSATHGDVVPLIYVAEAMARHAASGHGSLPVHWQTLKEIRPQYIALLLDAANNAHLTVCDGIGRIASAKELVDKAELPIESNTTDSLFCLNTKAKHLLEWGSTRGDSFVFVETPGTLVESDLRDFLSDDNGQGYGRVIERGYYRGAVGGGESEPWHDSFHGTALAPSATPAPVVVAVDGPAKRSRKPSWSTVAMPYMKSVFNAGKYKSSTVFYKALLSRADTADSPFTKLNGELYCTEAGTTVAEGTVGSKWKEIRAG